MKYLQEIIGDKQTALFKKYDIFFAFSNDQLEEGLAKVNRKKEEMTALSIGMVIPKEHVEDFLKEHTTIVEEGIAEDIAQAGLDAVIKRELYNHEAFYTGDISTTYDALSVYPGITQDKILAVFREEQEHAEV